LLNLFVIYKDPAIKGLELGAGVYNILDDSYAFIQSYNAGHAPLPAPSRDFLVRVTYQYGL